MVKSACGIEAVYMCFNGTGIWGGETTNKRYTYLLRLEAGHVILRSRVKIHDVISE